VTVRAPVGSKDAEHRACAVTCAAPCRPRPQNKARLRYLIYDVMMVCSEPFLRKPWKVRPVHVAESPSADSVHFPAVDARITTCIPTDACAPHAQ
jgi:hypothetical protein